MFIAFSQQETLFALTNAAHFLDIKGLFTLLSTTIADMIKGKSTEALCKAFNIPNDLIAKKAKKN